MSKRAKDAASRALPNYPPETYADNDEYIEVESERSMQRAFYRKGYEQAEKDIISLVESRLSELLGDAQPTPILRYELQDLIKKIKEEE